MGPIDQKKKSTRLNNFLTTENGSNTYPVTAEEHLTATDQEWSKLPKKPPIQWRHKLMKTYTDLLGEERGALNLNPLRTATPESLEYRTKQAYLGSSLQIITFSATNIEIPQDNEIHIPGWKIKAQGNTGWTAENTEKI